MQGHFHAATEDTLIAPPEWNGVVETIAADYAIDGSVCALRKRDGELLKGLGPGGKVPLKGIEDMAIRAPTEPCVECLGQMIHHLRVVAERGVGGDTERLEQSRGRAGSGAMGVDGSAALPCQPCAHRA